MGVIQDSEPVVFSSGDSLLFHRYLPEFPPATGWSLEYQVYSEAGTPVASFASQPSQNVPGESSHTVSVQNFLGNLPQPIQQLTLFFLAGYAINTSNGNNYRHQIYYGELWVAPNFAANTAVGSQVPFEIEMVRLYEDLNRNLAQHPILESDILRNRMIRESREKIRTELFVWQEKARDRIAKESVANGKPNPFLVRTVFNIIP